MHVSSSCRRHFSLFTLLVCITWPVAAARAQGDPQANHVSVPTPVAAGSSRLDPVSVAKGLGLAGVQLHAITVVQARYTKRRNALVERMIGDGRGGRGVDRAEDRAVILADLQALDQLQQQEIEAAMTPVQAASFRRLESRPSAGRVIPRTPVAAGHAP